MTKTAVSAKIAHLAANVVHAKADARIERQSGEVRLQAHRSSGTSVHYELWPRTCSCEIHQHANLNSIGPVRKSQHLNLGAWAFG